MPPRGRGARPSSTNVHKRVDDGRGPRRPRCPACNAPLRELGAACPCGAEALSLFDRLYDGHYPEDD